ncbi:MAG: hypothetical protein CM1200mP22_29260 [Dehalococcoidia bacterium]|nr:MAG: hypothetical protein CM1200mP22_29260 [Dehalococcoidia bacterium]
MNIENKIKAMGLELPTPGTPPAGRAGAYRSETSVRWRAYRRR